MSEPEPLVGFYRDNGGYVALYENVNSGATVRLTVLTLERAEAEDKRLRERGFVPVIRPE